jgi:hypothetical protein
MHHMHRKHTQRRKRKMKYDLSVEIAMADPRNKPEHFNELEPHHQQQLVDWIVRRLSRTKNFNYGFTSYGLKAIYEWELAGRGMYSYVTNGQFKGGMLSCGFRVKDLAELNWFFNVKVDKKMYDYYVANKVRLLIEED